MDKFGLTVFCVLFCIQCSYQLKLVPGGISEIPVDDPSVVRLSEVALTHLNSGDEQHSLVKIVKAERQVVSGTMTILTMDLVGKAKNSKQCTIKIWEQPWLDRTEVTKATCDGENFSPSKTARSKKSIHPGGGTHDIHIGIFNDFIKEHNKVYADEVEYKRRFHIFRANHKKIRALRENEQGTGKYGVTYFADMTTPEFQKYLGLKKPADVKELPQASIPNVQLPEEFDWRHYNVVTPVKNQGACGSCWAFSVTGNIEGQWALRRGKLFSLSEQEIVDCDKADSGCGGGYMTTAYDSIVKIGGLETETDYPYEASDDTCHFNKGEVKVMISGGINITSNETGMAQWLLKNGPMSVGLNANAMQFYLGGVSHPFKLLCNPQDIDHGVLIVGFGVHKSKILKKTMPYWIVKNSWGHGWGELGYYRLYRGDGTCGINQMVSSATIN